MPGSEIDWWERDPYLSSKALPAANEEKLNHTSKHNLSAKEQLSPFDSAVVKDAYDNEGNPIVLP